jgi:hypothetical protein
VQVIQHVVVNDGAYRTGILRKLDFRLEGAHASLYQSYAALQH